MGEIGHYMFQVQPPRGGWAQLQRVSARARQAAEEMQREGTPVRFLRSVFVPEDDACFFLYEGPSAESVREATSRAKLRAEHVTNTLVPDTEVGR